MVLWVGLIAKLVELVLSKIVGKQVDLRLDQREQAARAFLDLHEALGQLEAVALAFLAAVEPTLAGRCSYLWRAPFEAIAREGDSASRAFLDALSELRPAIAIYDPALMVVLGAIVTAKGIMADDLTTSKLAPTLDKMRFAVQPSREGFVAHYSAPSNRLLATDLEETYAFAQSLLQRPVGEWPRNLLASLVEDNLVDGRLTDEDLAQVRHLYEMMQNHTPALAKARTELEAFLRKNFSLDDLLYVTRKK